MSPLLGVPLLTALLAASPGPAAAPRVALLVANNRGLPDEAPLRHPGADAERLGAVLVELGGFARTDVHLVRNQTAAAILDAIDALAREAPASTFVFYYSGHADAAALHPEGTILPMDILLHRLRAVGAELRLGVLDACQSGAATRAKGSTPAAPFAVRVEGPGSSGDILISSSADDEQSFETELGGVFTLHFTAALRGAADANGNGQVTLGEAYEYAYAQTLRATLAASTGPQHARFRYDLAGRHDPVLTQLARGAQLTLQAPTDGEFIVFDGRERGVIAELPVKAGELRRVALAPGEYVVQQRSTRALRSARIQLVPGDDRMLLEHQMQETPLLRLARKGSLGERRLTATMGVQGSGLGPSGQLLGALGAEWDGPAWLLGADLAISSGQETHQGLTTQDLLVQASGRALWSWRLGSASIRAGPVGGLAVLRQETQGRPAAGSLGLTIGAMARADVEVTRTIGLFAALEGRGLLVNAQGTPGFAVFGLDLVPWWSTSLGVRVGF